MRKMGAKTIFIDCGLSRKDVRRELDHLNAVGQADAKAQAIVLSFFGNRVPVRTLPRASSDSLLGQAILINYSPTDKEGWISYIYEAVIQIPDYLLPPRNTRRVPVLNMIFLLLLPSQYQ